jgi:hypothetical protein
MSKQTAVRWLVSILNKDGFAPVLTNEEIQEALQMEREQMDNVAEDWWNEGASYVYNGVKKYESFNKYYE